MTIYKIITATRDQVSRHLFDRFFHHHRAAAQAAVDPLLFPTDLPRLLHSVKAQGQLVRTRATSAAGAILQTQPLQTRESRPRVLVGLCAMLAGYSSKG